VEIAIVGNDTTAHHRIRKELPILLDQAAKKRSREEGRPVVYSHHPTPIDSYSRVTSSRTTHVRIDVYVLREYQNADDLRHRLQQNASGDSKSDHRSATELVVELVDELVDDGGDLFPLFHLEDPQTHDFWPPAYITNEEMYPLQTVSFGHIQLRAPSESIGILRRGFGQDCFTHFSCEPHQVYKGANSLPNGRSKRIPLSDMHYFPLQHSRRRGWSNHCKGALNLTLEEYDEMQRSRCRRREPSKSSEPLTPATSSSSSSSSSSSTSSSSGSTGMSRTRTLFSFDDPKAGDVYAMEGGVDTAPRTRFGQDLKRILGESIQEPTFGSEFRALMEPHLRKARKEREICRAQRVAASSLDVHQSIASSVGVPYTVLRQERRFLFDDHSYPLNLVLAEILGVDDLSKLHEHKTQDKLALLQPLLANRRRFQSVYDSFVTSFCVPLLHSMAISKGILHSSSKTSSNNGSSRIVYRYQAFPSIQVVRPGEAGESPHCDTTHSIGSLNFFIPLTPIFGTNALYTESHPGKEDWHALTTKSFGLGYIYDGARCLHFSLDSTTADTTRVSLEFRVALYREEDQDSDDEENEHVGELSTPKLLQDDYSSPPGYYDEAIVDLGMDTFPGAMVAQKRSLHRLFDPDARNGFPFASMS